MTEDRSDIDKVKDAITRTTEAVYDDCLAIAKDFTGQGVIIYNLIKKHKEKAMAALKVL